MYCLIQRCSYALLLLAAISLAAPITTGSTPTSSTSPAVTAASLTLTPAIETTEEAELRATPSAPAASTGPATEPAATDPAATEPAATATTGPAAYTSGEASTVEEVVITFTTESSDAPYDCSLNSQTQQAQAIASFRKGLSLVVDELHTRYLVPLKTPTMCPSHGLSFLNYGTNPNVYHNLYGPGLQALASMVTRINGYAALVQETLRTNPDDTMQTLYDVLRGSVLDLYALLSPSHCNCATAPATPCFEIPPPLEINNFFDSSCNLVSYISSTIVFELQSIEFLAGEWLNSGAVGSEVVITTQQWLSTHVHEDSPAHNILQD